MLVPGTTIDVSLRSDIVYAVDRGVVKMMKYRGRSYADVLADIQRFVYVRGYSAPLTVIKFILKRIGLPDVKVFPDQEELTKDDVLELSRALNTVESLKTADYVYPEVAAGSTPEVPTFDIPMPDADAVAPQIEAEVLAAQRLTEETPLIKFDLKKSIWTSVPNSGEAEKLIVHFHLENIPKENSSKKKPALEQSGTRRRFVWDVESSIETGSSAAESRLSVDSAPGEQNLEVKVLMVGEQEVGIKSILYESGLELGRHGLEDTADHGLVTSKPFVYSSLIDHGDRLVRLNVWSFDKVQEARVPRAEFFAGACVVVIVYSVADRWSFDSLEFWVREVTSSFLIPPPLIIVGNKLDLREHPVRGMEDEPSEPPVCREDGQSFCDHLSAQLGVEGHGHPVAFIETSAVTGTGIQELLHKIVDSWLANERLGMPALEPQIATQ